MSHPHQREVAVFEAALQLPPDRREAYLQQTCAGDPDLLQRIRALLEAEANQTDFLAPGACAPRPALAASLPPTEKAGDCIGPYRLLQQIGEGGCGVVYMAEQEKPIRRRVALKIIKLGMDTRQVVARFEAERQALALMDHPNIAKVHDAGATAAGRPYFVMELVRGVKITDYCDQKRLSAQHRLELFIQVCQAVQHAHQKGIIHRDLKPSNILVTVNDGVAVPKVIDFGIAKATNGERLTDKTIFTAFEQFIGTPAYMSPEQAEITSVDIDTRSDIYSLGVLLYELLTGQTPFDAKELLKAGLDEMRRTIREKEPARPSTRLSTLNAAELTTAAERRGLEAPGLISLLRGDLDWIVMKCLEKDRGRRYETANGLATDIRRHLSNEPVVARPPSRLYEFQKTVRRHKLGFAATTAVIISLLIGLGISTWMFLQERAAKLEQVRLRHEAEAARNRESEQRRLALNNEARALAESAKSAQVAQLLKNMLQGVNPAVAAGRDTTLLHLIVDTTSTNILSDLRGQPEAQAELFGSIGYVYLTIGDYSKAEEMCGRAVALRRAMPVVPTNALALSLKDLAMTLRNEGKLKKAEAALEEALGLLRNVAWTNDRVLPDVLYELSVVRQYAGRDGDAEKLLNEALDFYHRMGTNGLEGAAWSLRTLSEIRTKHKRLTEAEQYARESLHAMQEIGTAPQIAWCWDQLGEVMEVARKFTEAEHSYLEALAIKHEAYGKGNKYLLQSLLRLSSSFYWDGRLPESEAYLREAVEIEKPLDPSFDSLWPLLHLAELSRDRGQTAEAQSLEHTAFTCLCGIVAQCKTPLTYLVVFAYGHDWGSVQDEVDAFRWCRKAAESGSPDGLNDLAWLLATCPDQRVRNGRESVGFADAAVALTSRKDAGILDTLAAAYAEKGDFEKAITVEEEALSLVPHDALRQEMGARLALFKGKQAVRDYSFYAEAADYFDVLGQNLLVRGKVEKAERLARKYLSMQEHGRPNDWRTFQSRAQLGACLFEQKKYAEAEGLLLSGYQGVEQCTNQLPPSVWAHLRENGWRLVRLYEETRMPEKAADWKARVAELNRTRLAKEQSALSFQSQASP